MLLVLSVQVGLATSIRQPVKKHLKINLLSDDINYYLELAELITTGGNNSIVRTYEKFVDSSQYAYTSTLLKMADENINAQIGDDHTLIINITNEFGIVSEWGIKFSPAGGVVFVNRKNWRIQIEEDWRNTIIHFHTIEEFAEFFKNQAKKALIRYQFERFDNAGFLKFSFDKNETIRTVLVYDADDESVVVPVIDLEPLLMADVFRSVGYNVVDDTVIAMSFDNQTLDPVSEIIKMLKETIDMGIFQVYLSMINHGSSTKTLYSKGDIDADGWIRIVNFAAKHNIKLLINNIACKNGGVDSIPFNIPLEKNNQVFIINQTKQAVNTPVLVDIENNFMASSPFNLFFLEGIIKFNGNVAKAYIYASDTVKYWFNVDAQVSGFVVRSNGGRKVVSTKKQ